MQGRQRVSGLPPPGRGADRTAPGAAGTGRAASPRGRTVPEDAAPRGVAIELGALSVPVISRQDLAANKRACGRPQDLADLDALERLGDE